MDDLGTTFYLDMYWGSSGKADLRFKSKGHSRWDKLVTCINRYVNDEFPEILSLKSEPIERTRTRLQPACTVYEAAGTGRFRLVHIAIVWR